MIDPDKFYSKSDSPNERVKRRMWNSIKHSLFPSVNTRSFMFEKRSFVYGMAASFILLFACIGIYSTFTRIIEVARPQEIRMESAYQTAIREFENVALPNNDRSTSPGSDEKRSTRNIQLRFLNNAIEELRKETNLQEDEFIILAGENYRKFLLPSIKHFEIPLKGLGIGKQLQWLSKRIKNE